MPQAFYLRQNFPQFEFKQIPLVYLIIKDSKIYLEYPVQAELKNDRMQTLDGTYARHFLGPIARLTGITVDYIDANGNVLPRTSKAQAVYRRAYIVPGPQVSGNPSQNSHLRFWYAMDEILTRACFVDVNFTAGDFIMAADQINGFAQLLLATMGDEIKNNRSQAMPIQVDQYYLNTLFLHLQAQAAYRYMQPDLYRRLRDTAKQAYPAKVVGLLYPPNFATQQAAFSALGSREGLVYGSVAEAQAAAGAALPVAEAVYVSRTTLEAQGMTFTNPSAMFAAPTGAALAAAAVSSEEDAYTVDPAVIASLRAGAAAAAAGTGPKTVTFASPSTPGQRQPGTGYMHGGSAYEAEGEVVYSDFAADRRKHELQQAPPAVAGYGTPADNLGPDYLDADDLEIQSASARPSAAHLGHHPAADGGAVVYSSPTKPRPQGDSAAYGGGVYAEPDFSGAAGGEGLYAKPTYSGLPGSLSAGRRGPLRVEATYTEGHYLETAPIPGATAHMPGSRSPSPQPAPASFSQAKPGSVAAAAAASGMPTSFAMGAGAVGGFDNEIYGVLTEEEKRQLLAEQTGIYGSLPEQAFSLDVNQLVLRLLDLLENKLTITDIDARTQQLAERALNLPFINPKTGMVFDDLKLLYSGLLVVVVSILNNADPTATLFEFTPSTLGTPCKVPESLRQLIVNANLSNAFSMLQVKLLQKTKFFQRKPTIETKKAELQALSFLDAYFGPNAAAQAVNVKIGNYAEIIQTPAYKLIRQRVVALAHQPGSFSQVITYLQAQGWDVTVTRR